MTQETRDRLVQENVELLKQGLDLIHGLPPGAYANNEHEHFTSGIGKHFRHVLDVYSQVLAGHAEEIDYDSRERDERIEQDPEFAVQTTESIIAGLGSLRGARDGATSVTVRTEIHTDAAQPIPVSSSVERELAHLASHTVHHYALIGLLARLQGSAPPADFGVAPSTIRFMARKS